MDVSNTGSEPVRELRVEGLGWFVVGALLLGVVAGAFFLGRWFERSARPEPSAQAARGPLPAGGPAATAPDLEATEGATYFDGVDRGAQALEPGREVRRPAAAPEARPAPPEPAATPAGGPFVVQVFATRDRQTAESLIEKMRGQGLSVRLSTQREGQGELVRVRVGGYRTEEEARQAAQELQKQGYPGAFVARPE